MNKKRKKRAILVFLLLLLFHLLLLFDLPQRYMQGKKGELVKELSPFFSRSENKEEVEWRVPNVTYLPVKKAIEKLLPYTENIRVYGSGYVVRQYPRAFEITKGEIECVLYAEATK